MQILIQNRGGAPIYDQIYAQLKEQIITGSLEEGALLPSIRQLAKDLQVSVITTKRAYEELEREGYLYTVAGKGCYVAPRSPELIREEHYKTIESLLGEVVRLAALCRISKEEIFSLYTLLEEEGR